VLGYTSERRGRGRFCALCPSTGMLAIGALVVAVIFMDPSAGSAEENAKSDTKVTQAASPKPKPKPSITYDQLHLYVQGYRAPTEITLNRKTNDTRGRYQEFTFNHSEHTDHTELGCGFCHHKAIANGRPVTCSTAGCHDVGGKLETRAKTKWAHKGGRVKEIAGAGVSCRACHKSEGAGTGCTDCHDKR